MKILFALLIFVLLLAQHDCLASRMSNRLSRSTVTKAESNTIESQLDNQKNPSSVQPKGLENEKTGQSNEQKVSWLARLFGGGEPSADNDEEQTAGTQIPLKLNGRTMGSTQKPAHKDLASGKMKEMEVRVTVYWKSGSGTDRWTAAGRSSTGRQLKNRQSCAVDPKVIPYGSRVLLPEAGKSLEAVDTGSAVKARKAARAMGKDVPVVDVFFTHKHEALRWAHSNPHFMKAYVVTP